MYNCPDMLMEFLVIRKCVRNISCFISVGVFFAFRSMYTRYIDDKRENEMAKFGAILAQVCCCTFKSLTKLLGHR